MKIAVIGGGAAGFFAAISARTHHTGAEVALFEATGKVLQKVKVSGGGRCNVAHDCHEIAQLSKSYPRGEKFLKKAFHQFSTADTIAWYAERGVKLKSEPDGRMFPISNSSQTIVDCLFNALHNLNISLKLHHKVTKLEKAGDKFFLHFSRGDQLAFDKVIVASGGSPKTEGLEWLRESGHQIEPPVPSLFTFNMPGEAITELMGVVAEPVNVRIQGTKLQSSGPLLITHWGMSGPAILRLSAFGARILHDMDYRFHVQVNWLDTATEHLLRQHLEVEKPTFSKRQVGNKNPFQLPTRLWLYLLQKTGIPLQKTWGELGKKALNRLINVLTNDLYCASGKTTFKEEFVTCGGVSLQDISPATMQSRKCPGLYFAGEVMDIDGITGGFNFQAAWTTGFIAGKCGQGI
ncbi:MAG: NAD(P)/FAD-dependent oxidoreductase [Bacteroidia bacterium]